MDVRDQRMTTSSPDRYSTGRWGTKGGMTEGEAGERIYTKVTVSSNYDRRGPDSLSV